MQEPIDHETMAICSVTAVATQVGLSRAWFYELMKEGVFPQPLYSLRTKRPFYPLDLQKKCVEIRTTGIGLAAQPIVFNAPRKRGKHNDQPEIDYDELARTLRGMGLRVTNQHVRKAIAEVYSKGSAKGVSEESMIRDLYLHFVRER